MSYPTGINDDPAIPTVFVLYPNYPNPFNAQTTINYNLTQASDVALTIYDILGRKVQTLYSGVQSAGFHTISWDAGEVSSGVYFYKLTAGKYEKSAKMMLIK